METSPKLGEREEKIYKLRNIDSDILVIICYGMLCICCKSTRMGICRNLPTFCYGFLFIGVCALNAMGCLSLLSMLN